VDRIAGRTAFVTGASSGIGRAIAVALAEAGARVVSADREPGADDQAIGGSAGSALTLCLDVTDRAGWAEARVLVEERFGPVDVLVNNAGVAPDWNELADMPPGHFDGLVAIMLTGVFNGISTFGPSMRAMRSGHIVNIASLVALTPAPRQGAYVAAKSAVIGLSEVLRLEMAPHNVGVTVACPGRVRSNLLRDHRPAHLSADHGMEPDQVAERVLDAIRGNDLYVMTHPEHRPLVAARLSGVLDAFDRSDPGAQRTVDMHN
jgi:NAD(P)-dependent dehydrogenase (short-subunit alcohol dehydrogenase family)